MPDMSADVEVRDEGSVMLFTPLTAAARAWIRDHVAEGATFWGPALVVEPRFAADLAEGMIGAGLVVTRPPRRPDRWATTR